MINNVELENFGPLEHINWQDLGQINLIIGNNDCGKSFLLKALYTAIRTIEDYKRGDNPKSIQDILQNKLYWTFQVKKMRDLINKSNSQDLLFKMSLDQQEFNYNISTSETGDLIIIDGSMPRPRLENSIFLPPKEILSLHRIVLTSRQIDKLFGFDDTYLDLAYALQTPPINFSSLENSSSPTISNKFRQALEDLETIIGGKIELDNDSKRWIFKKGNQHFSIGTTAEGIKKIAVLDTLLSNGYLNEKSIIFIDELESALHPEAITALLDIISILAKQGIQFFISSHSYFVVKKLFLMAQEQKISIPIISNENNKWVTSNLLDDMPDNPIIDESIRLYEQEVDLAFS